MSLSPEQYAFLAHKIYEPLTVGSNINSHTREFKVLYVSPTSATNYRGAVVQDQTTRQLIVVNKGTDPTNIHDLITDVGMGAMRAPTQWPEAARTMRWALQHAEENHIPKSDVSVTGHSLGGALAQLQAALPEAAGVYAETFNAYGARAMAETLSRHQPLSVSSAQERIVNRRMHHDPVSDTRIAEPIGKVVEYMDHADYLRHSKGSLSPVGEAGAIAASHGIGNFWDRDRNQPGAVLAHNYMLDYIRDLQHRALDDLPRGVPLDLSAPWHTLGQHERVRTPAAVDVAAMPFAADDRYDPRHLGAEKHALYSALQERVPDAGPNRLLQFTAACHENGIAARNLDRIHLNEERMTIEFHGKGWLATPAVIDLTKPSPEPERSIQQIQQVDQQEMQIAQQIAQSAQLSQQGPVR